jgi:hypothetical protein
MVQPRLFKKLGDAAQLLDEARHHVAKLKCFHETDAMPDAIVDLALDRTAGKDAKRGWATTRARDAGFEPSDRAAEFRAAQGGR